MRAWIVAHRGGAGEGVLENSMQAFRYALSIGCDAIETDLRAGKEGEIYALHDATLTRTARVRKMFKSLSPREISKIRLKNGEKIPRLSSLLNLVRRHNLRSRKKVALFLEIKENGFEEKLVKILQKFKMANPVLLISFHKSVLQKMHLLNPTIKTGLLFHKPIPPKQIPDFCSAILPHHTLATPRSIVKWRALGKEIFVWTVDDTRTAARLFGKVHGLISDCPALLKKTERRTMTA